MKKCLVKAGTSISKKQKCLDRGFRYAYLVKSKGIKLRFKYYAYWWDYHYAQQMHHKYIIIDNETLFSGSYNFSDNAEHNTIENIIIYKASKYPNLLKAFNTNFNKLWETERINGTYQNLLNKIQGATKWISVVFKPMSLTWDQVDKLKKAIRKKCPDVNSTKVRANPHKNKTCYL